MAGPGISHSQLAAKLIVDGCLAGIAGTVQGKMPVAGVQLTELERADIGLTQRGHTFFYPLSPTGVFCNLAGTTCTVWFMGANADADHGLQALEAAMKRAYPKAKQAKDDVDPTDAALRTRRYEIDFGNSRLAVMDVWYPARNVAPKKFQAHISALIRRN